MPCLPGCPVLPPPAAPDQDVGAALLLPAVGRPGALDVAGAAEDGVAAGADVVGARVGPVEGVGTLLVVVPGTDDVVGAVVRGRLRVEGAAGWGATTPPAGVVVWVALGCTFR